MASRVPDAVVEVIDHGIAVEPVVVVTGAQREFRRRRSVKCRSERARLNVYTEIVQGDAGDFRWISIVPRDDGEVEYQLFARLIPSSGPDFGVVVIADAREHVIRRAMFSVEVETPVFCRARLKAAEESVGVVLFHFRSEER